MPKPLRTLDPDPEGRYSTLQKGFEVVRASKDRSEEAPYVPFATASEAEVENVLEWRDILRDHDGFRLLTQYLLHATYRADNGGYLADWRTLFRQFGYGLYRSGNRPNARTLLWAYKLFVDKDLTWTASHSDGRARTITGHGIPRPVRILRDMHARWPGEFESVLFPNGNKVSRASKKRLKEKLGEPKPAEPVIDPPEDARRFREYLQERPPELFTSIANRVGAVREGVVSGDLEVPPSERERVLETLRGIEEAPKPRYELSHWSPRLRSPGRNQLVGLDSRLRKALYGDNHVELDLSKAHAAIAEAEWGELGHLRSWLEKHLQGKIDFWEALASTVLNTGNPPPQSDQRAAEIAVKKGLYTLVYGGKRNAVLFEMAKTYGDALGIEAPSTETFETFLQHPMPKELLEARNQKLEAIRQKGRVVDCYGRTIPTAKFEESPRTDNPARAALAYCVQARELHLLRPLFDLAEKEERRVEKGRKQRPAFQILLYQYDGVTVSVTRKERREVILSRLQKAVREHARRLGILTRLEVDWMAPEPGSGPSGSKEGRSRARTPRNRHERRAKGKGSGANSNRQPEIF